MNELNFTESAQQENQITNFRKEGGNHTTNSQEVMQPSCSSARLGRFPSLSPVLFGYNYILSTCNTNTNSGRPGGGENENVKQLWSAEELTLNLVNKTAMRIANLKHKLDEQLKNIKILQGNKEKYRDYPEPIHQQDHFDNSHIPLKGDSHISLKGFDLSNTNGETQTVKKFKNQTSDSKRTTKTKESGKTKIQRPIVSQTKRRKRLRRGVPLKEFFYHPLVVDCSASVPEELTKEEFLRQLRLIPKSYFITH